MKYYYTDALKATWMILRQDMIMEEELNLKGFGKEGSYYEDSLFEQVKKHYIHPDCHEMLKPQVGDVIITDYMPNMFLKITRITNDDVIKCGNSIFNFEDINEIIQRNGKAFFMPEIGD